MDFQFAEAAAEFNMTFVRELLAAEIDHDVIVEGLLDFRKGPIIQLQGEIKFDIGTAGVAALGY
jgi:hypothetical protein